GVLIYACLLVGVFVWAISALWRQRSASAIKVSFLLAIVLSGMPFIGPWWVTSLLVCGLVVYLFGGFCKKVPVRVFNVIILSVFLIFVGYSSYALLLIRSHANTPMNQNAPDNVFALGSYLNREQYGDRPLFSGAVFAEELQTFEYPEGSGTYYVEMDAYGRPRTRLLDGVLRDEAGQPYNNPKTSYTKTVKTDPSQPDKYVEGTPRPDYEELPDLKMLLPRVYSNDPTHVEGYKGWSQYSIEDLDNIPAELRNRWAADGFAPLYEVAPYLVSQQTVVTAVDHNGNDVEHTSAWRPSFADNLRYFFNYQFSHMYWRYFMWNFAGRQNDLAGNGEPHLGNWISGIPVIDNARLGDQSLLPDEFGKGNKGHNVFYMLPLLLGIIGLLWQALYVKPDAPQRGIEQFWVICFLFFMTGIAIVLYLNQTPGQPRERDYAFAGSFYAFAMWIGVGVPAIGIMLRDLLGSGKGAKEKPSKTLDTATAALACLIGIAVPLQMVSQTWDDHDRSGRYTTRDFGFNYLSSLDKDAIIFTNGDNDTFPLWYAQEVEGFRTDVRVVNLSYLTTDWYADQMKHPTSGAGPVDMLARPQDYAYERMAYSFVIPRDRNVTDARKALQALYGSDAKTYGAPYLETPKVVMPVDAEAAMARYSSGDAAVDSMNLKPYLSDIHTDLSTLGSGLNQSKVLSLDIVANSVANNWKRPAYFAFTVPSSYYLGLTPYLSATGMAYEVTPFYDAEYNPTAEKSYRNIVADYRWGGLDAPDATKLYLDETVRRMVSSVRSGIYTIVENLMMTPQLEPTAETKKVARENGLDVPATHADMARQLLNLTLEKMPAEVSPFDSMLGLYFARTYIDLYMLSGNPADLEAADRIASAEAERYAQLVKYATTLDPVTLSQLGRSETYALQYLGEAVALKNQAEILAADSSLLSDPDRNDDRAALSAMTLETDLRVAPLVYIQGYDYDMLAKEIDSFPDSQKAVIRKAMNILALNEAAGVDPMRFSRELMDRYSLTPAEWNYVIN
ncbi:MAG: hypothetical protein K2I04_00830, partial [Muribaculaceae bacterium]|nr:hypothetical protein [Muribaculaceae bacterium]